MSKQKILDAAEQVFSRKGYYQTSMQDIATEAKVAKGTLYYHFKSKDELFIMLMEQGTTFITDELQKSFIKEISLKEQINDFIEKAMHICLKYNSFSHILFNEMSNGMSPEVLQRVSELEKEYTNIFEEILKVGYEAGCVREVNFELAAISLITTLYHLCDHIAKGKTTEEEVQSFLITYVTNGLLTA